MASAEILPPGSLQVERLPNGRRMLLRELNLRINGRHIRVPEGFVTDFSSWPRWLPGPATHRIDLAGVVHDALFQWGRWGVEKEADKVSFIEANRAWYTVARSGTNKGARANWFWALVGRAGLFLFGWPVWLGYRATD